MTTRLEKIAESMKKEKHRQDIRKLKRAVEYLNYGLAVLEDGFHNEDYTKAAEEIIGTINGELVYVRKVIEEG